MGAVHTSIFNWLKISGYLCFRAAENDLVFFNECDFRYLNIEDKAILEFDGVDLSKARFLHTNLEKINFRDVLWYNPSKFLFGRNKAIWDEFKQLEKYENERDYDKIAENYRQLVKNNEKKRDFDTAEQFHIGEMEIRRKKKGAGKKSKINRTIKEWLNTYNLYRLLSNYGTNYWQAFIILFLMLFVLFPLLFLIPSFRPMPLTPYSPELIKNYWDSLSFTLSSLPISRGYSIQYKGLGAHILSVVTVIALSSQFAILLLAIRRRFKR